MEAWQNSVEERINSRPHAPSYVLKGRNGSTPVDLILVGMLLECQDLLHPEFVWYVKIVKNVGGRLQLKFEGDRRLEDDEDEEEEENSSFSASFFPSSPTFWLFYSSPLLHPIGWGAANGFDYRPPHRIIDKDDTFAFWVDTLRQTLFAPVAGAAEDKFVPREVFVGQRNLESHHFVVGMKVEALDPERVGNISPATIVKVVGDKFFFVQIDAVRGELFSI